MKQLLDAADRCIAKLNWKDLALIKLCLCAAGVLMGLAAPRRYRKGWAFGAGALFALTYLPLMMKFLPCLLGLEKERQNG